MTYASFFFVVLSLTLSVSLRMLFLAIYRKILISLKVHLFSIFLTSAVSVQCNGENSVITHDFTHLFLHLLPRNVWSLDSSRSYVLYILFPPLTAGECFAVCTVLETWSPMSSLLFCLGWDPECWLLIKPSDMCYCTERLGILGGKDKNSFPFCFCPR